MGKKEEFMYKHIYNDAKNYNSAQCIESKLMYISLINNKLKFLVNKGAIDRYRVLRDENNNEKISKIVLQHKGFKTLYIIVDSRSNYAMFEVMAYAKTVKGNEVTVPLGKFKTEEQANKFCQSDDLCNNEIIIKLCAYYPDLEPWDFSHKILYID